MTDRDMLRALYKAVEKLYFATTGEPLSVWVETGAGWVKLTDYEAAATLADQPQG